MESIAQLGMKKTELGWLPEDWEVKTYGEIFRFYSTSSHSRAQLESEAEVQCLHYGDIHTKFHFSLSLPKDTMDGCSLEEAKNYEFIQNGDLIMADASEDVEGIGKSVEIKDLEGYAIAGLHTIMMRDTNHLLADGFKGYLHMIPAVSNLLRKIATGLKVYGISKNKLKEVPIPLPPLPEQQAIAQVLSDMDALIQQTTALIEKKQRIKEGTMQTLLTGKTRVKGFEGSGRYQQTELGAIPEEWEVIKLGNFSKINTGNKDTQDRVDSGKFPFYVRSSQIERIDTYSFDGEAILTSGDGVGVGKVFHYVNGKFDYHQRVYNIHNFSKNTNGKYIFFQFCTRFNERVMSMTAKSSVDSVRKEMIADMPIPLPPLKEQQAIAQILSDMDAELDALAAKLQKYEYLKQGMMQTLLMGQIRLC